MRLKREVLSRRLRRDVVGFVIAGAVACGASISALTLNELWMHSVERVEPVRVTPCSPLTIVLPTETTGW